MFKILKILYHQHRISNLRKDIYYNEIRITQMITDIQNHESAIEKL